CMNARQVMMLGLIAVTRGSSFLFVAIALKSFGPFVITFFQFLLAALTLGAAALFTGELGAAFSRLRQEPGPTLTFGMTQAVIPYLLVTLGQQVIPSSLAAILLATAPLFVVLLAWVFDQSERMQPLQIGGLLVGLPGVALVAGGGKVTSFAQILGMGAIILAAASNALSGLVMKRFYHTIPPITGTFLAFLTGVPLLLPFAVFSHPYVQPGVNNMLTILVIGVLNTALPLVVYIQLLREVGAGRALLMTYLSPAVALLLAAVILHEVITVWAVLGLVFILSGVMAVARQPHLPIGKVRNQ